MSVIKVVMEEPEIRVATMLAVERWRMKRDSTDKESYAIGKKQGLLEHELLANLRANISESAVSKYYALPWTTPFYMNSEHNRRWAHADVGASLEVRTLRTRSEVPFWEKDLQKGNLVVATHVSEFEYCTVVDILGWWDTKNTVLEDSWKNIDYQTKKWDGSWRIPIDQLQDPTTLPTGAF
jgi:hypothetical protein